MKDYKKTNASGSTITRNLLDLSAEPGNVYKMVNIVAKRANQISVELKDELNQKLEDFASYTDNLEEIHENREQIEISKFYERLPKATLIALQEMDDKEIYYRNPLDDAEQEEED